MTKCNNNYKLHLNSHCVIVAKLRSKKVFNVHAMFFMLNYHIEPHETCFSGAERYFTSEHYYFHDVAQCAEVVPRLKLFFAIEYRDYF